MSDDVGAYTDDSPSNPWGFDTYVWTLAILAFSCTAVDDFCVVLIFFSLALDDARKNNKTDAELFEAYGKILMGSIIAFTVLVAISLIGMGLGLLIPDGYIDLIGFIPILIGGNTDKY